MDSWISLPMAQRVLKSSSRTTTHWLVGGGAVAERSRNLNSGIRELHLIK